ncbi:hypothetical protein PLEOSDRAFT_158747 [Pleurotus ostreatus PC15]|uniref:Uncharacterized protein n=1 Tax=Pleurotus ostreatus (strain PC15) TaxID=1137138 RepID=A0A067NHR6_PLEO1|nr:hypothetical protein PLEOSDRAFT_158747 [Pleurotus ostreatus PC15]
MNRPEDLTADSLKDAKVVQLRFWISTVNTTTGKRVLNISGKAAELKKRLADHFNIDISAPAAPSIARTTGIKRENEDNDDGIVAQQWLHLRKLGEEWAQCEAAGVAFILGKGRSGSGLPSCLQATLDTAVANVVSRQIDVHGRRPPLESPLSDAGQAVRPISTVNAETVSLWLRSLQETGDLTALGNLSQLRSTLPTIAVQTPLPPPTPFVSSPSAPATVPLHSESTAHRPTAIQAVLAAGKAEIRAIERASGLRDILLQREEVARLRNLYGPKTDTREPSNPLWSQMKMALTRPRFLKFFTKNEPAVPRKRKRPHDLDPNHHKELLQPFRRVVEAIKCRNDAIAAEKRQAMYLSTSQEFSQSLWHQRWGDQNDWEVWRALGKEQY